MIYVNQNMMCCGTREIHNLAEYAKKEPEEALKDFCEAGVLLTKVINWYAPYDPVTGVRPFTVTPQRNPGAAHFIFTQANKTAKYGTRFAKLIADYDLGYLEQTAWGRNPNTCHFVKVWVWTPDFKKLRKWYEENKG